MKKTNLRHILSVHRIMAAAVLLFMVLASSSAHLYAQTLTQGYGSDETLQRGMIIQLKKGDTTKVEPTTIATQDQMHGVVVDANDAPVTLSEEGQKVFVATSGHYQVLVSDQNGAINPGDYIAVSAINGIGMRGTSNDPIIIGRALGTFDGKVAVVSTAVVKNSTGAEIPVNIGRIDVDLKVSRNPLLKSPDPNVSDILRRASESIAGKPVSAVRAYLSFFIFLSATFIAGSLMYGGVRSSIISVGRNPLSRKSIIRGMLQVIISGLIIFITGLFGVYLLLKL